MQKNKKNINNGHIKNPNINYNNDWVICMSLSDILFYIIFIKNKKKL